MRKYANMQNVAYDQMLWLRQAIKRPITTALHCIPIAKPESAANSGGSNYSGAHFSHRFWLAKAAP